MCIACVGLVDRQILRDKRVYRAVLLVVRGGSGSEKGASYRYDRTRPHPRQDINDLKKGTIYVTCLREVRERHMNDGE